jgi:tetratricopeptide (TPR) repeat protein
LGGHLERAAGHHAEGLEIFKNAGDRWGVCTCLINLGEVHRKMGRVEEAVGYWEKSLPIAREIGAQLSVAISHVNTGGALAAVEGQEERALENLRLALKEALAIGALPIALEGLVSVALIHAREGQQPLAARILGMVTSHPSFNAEIQAYSDPVMKQLRKRLGAESLTSLLDQGRSLDLATFVGEFAKGRGGGE